MLGLRFTFRFNIGLISRKVREANRKALGYAAGYVRKVARSSIKSRKRISLPGFPPSSHTHELREFILYDVSDLGDYAIIGARRLSKPGLAPKALEHGGMDPLGHFYQPRPFMEPALEETKRRLPDFWKNSFI